MPRTPFEQTKRAKRPGATGADPKRKSFRKRSADAPTFDACNPVLLHAIVCLCTTYGASPTFSYTRDGTSLVIAVYYQGERTVDYLSGNEELQEWAAWLVTDLLECEDVDLQPYAFIAPKKP